MNEVGNVVRVGGSLFYHRFIDNLTERQLPFYRLEFFESCTDYVVPLHEFYEQTFIHL